MRKRKIMKYAGMMVIKLLPADVQDFELKTGDKVDVEQILKVRIKNKNPLLKSIQKKNSNKKKRKDHK